MKSLVNQHSYHKIIFHSLRGGLCNRLRALSACLCVSKFLDIPLEICWQPHESCNCYFDDIYEKPTKNNVKFTSPETINLTSHESDVIYVNQMKGEDFFYDSYLRNIVDKKDFDVEYIQCVRSFKIKPNLLTQIEGFSNQFGFDEKILGVHIRRTDHINYIKLRNLESRFSSDEKFINTIEREISEGYSKIFLATDNELSKKMIFKNFSGQTISYCEQFSDDYQRHTSVEDAVIDIYLLSRCQKIIGTYGSSFSKYAALLGNIPLVYPK